MNISLNGSLQITNFNDKDTVSFNQSFNTTGSNRIRQSYSMSLNTWQALPTGSNVDFSIGTFTNNDATASIYIALGGTGSYASILTPGDTCLLQYNQRVTVYAFATGSTTPAQLNYTIVSNN